MSTKCTVEMLQVVDYVTGLLDEDQRAEVRDHVASGCATCTDRLALIGTMAADGDPSQSERLLAQPLLDTQLHARAPGVRGSATLSRRRVYEAESRICIDIQQHEMTEGSATLEGQVLIRGGSLLEVAQAIVALRQDGASISESSVDALGDFSIPDVSPGRYDLTVVLEDMEVVVKGIEV